MSEQRQYAFCPKCGAVMSDGVCPSCGPKRRIRKRQMSGAGRSAEQKMLQADRSYQEQKIRRTGQMARMVLLFMASTGILLIFLLICNAVKGMVFRNLEQRFESEEQEQWSEAPAEVPDAYVDDIFDGSLVTEDPDAHGEYLHGTGKLSGGRPAVDTSEKYPYVPDPEEDFYWEITDAFEYNLSYTVEWESIEMGPAVNGQKSSYQFPQAQMEDEALEERINSRIQEMLSVEIEGREKRSSAIYYVTYMSEDVLSIVLRLRVVDDSDGYVHSFIRAVNFDMHTGEEIPPEEIMPISLGLCARFWNLCAWEHPGRQETIDNFESVEALAERLMDERQSFVYYTPVGVELGLNGEDGGWFSVTLNREHSLPFYRYFLKGSDYEPEPDYIPSADDAYYRRLVNAVPAKFMDSVEFVDRSYEDETGRYYFHYPQLTGDRFPNEENINAQIERLACPGSAEAYIGAPDGVETVSYVTYMDEEIMSVVVCMYNYRFNYEGIWEDLDMLFCITFDLTTGQEIPKDEIIDIDIGLARQFQALVAEQEDKNEDTFGALNETPEEILKWYLTDDWNNLVFYTPVGLEVGYNRIGYYVTVTMKENKT